MALLTNRLRGTRLRRIPTETETPAPRAARRRRWRWLTVVLVLAAIFWFLPAIVAHTPLLSWILARVTAKLNGTVAVESASLGWFSPITAQGIEVRDAEGEPVLQAPKLEGTKSLAAILLNWSRLGQFRLEQPRLTVLLREDGSNVEDLLANYLAPREEPTGIDVALEVVDGSVSVTDRSSRRTWRIEKLQLSLSTSADAGGTLKLETSAALPDPKHSGRFAAGLTIEQHDAEDRPPESAGELTIESDDLPLALFQSFVGRFAPRTQLSGWLGGKIRAQWNGLPSVGHLSAPPGHREDMPVPSQTAARAAGKTVVQADVTTRDFALSAPPLGTDRLQLGHLHAVCQVSRQEDRLEIKRAAVDCDLGSASLSGTLDLGERSGSLLDLVLHQTCEIEGRVELARLAQVLPGTLRIRQQTQITSGQVQLALSSRRNLQGPDPQGTVWQGRIEASNLQATYRDRQLAWDRPILLTLAAHQSPQGPVVESLRCESDFLKLHAAGTSRELAASADFNLRKLADQLGQFVDLGGISLGGEGSAQLNWTRSDQQQFEADAELQLRDFQLAIAQRKSWKEDNLLLFLSASGRIRPFGGGSSSPTDAKGADTQLHAASLEIKTPTDHIQAKLTQPVGNSHGDSPAVGHVSSATAWTWPVDLKAQGQLQTWPARVGAWIAVDGIDPAGAYQLEAEVTASTGRITAHRARLSVEQFRLLSPSLNIAEPAVEVSFSGDWDLRQRRLRMEPATLTSNSLSVQASNLTLDMPEHGPLKTAATLKYQGNLERLQQWIADPKAGRKWRVAGQLSGTAELSSSEGLTDAQLDAEAGNLDVTFSSGARFREPVVHLVARGSYEPQAKTLQLQRLDLSSGTLAARTAGHIAQRDGKADLQLAGQVDYNLEKLPELLRPYVGPGVQIVGRGTGPASYRGPLELARAQAEAGARWEWAEAYGFRVGPGELKAALADGVLRTEPLDLAVNGGRLLLAPRLRLAPEPTELTLPPGPLVERVQITPAMCASALKYIAPVLADVSTTKGSFSIALEGCRVPVGDPAKGELAGRLTIHTVEVGPGPLVREMAVLLGRATPAKLRRESVVPFRMVGGRVYHQGLELIFPDLTIRTYGSVGLDQTLALMAEMPVPPKWLGNNVLGSALRNQTVRLPIGGTLSKPKIDQRELDRVSRQFLENAARNVIEDELNKQLERLLGPPR